MAVQQRSSRHELSARHLSCGVPGLDVLLGGGLFEGSAMLVTGAPGTGKSLLGYHFMVEGAKRGEPGLLVCLEENADQVIRSAEKLGLPLGQLSKTAMVEVVFLSRELVQAGQVWPMLAGNIERRHVKRLVIDSLNNILPDALARTDRHLPLKNLILGVQHLGVTSMLTMEASYRLDRSTSELLDLAEIAGHVLVLGYTETEGSLQRTLSILARGSPTAARVYPYAIGRGGVRFEPEAEELGPGDRPRWARIEPAKAPSSRPMR